MLNAGQILARVVGEPKDIPPKRENQRLHYYRVPPLSLKLIDGTNLGNVLAGENPLTPNELFSLLQAVIGDFVYRGGKVTITPAFAPIIDGHDFTEAEKAIAVLYLMSFMAPRAELVISRRTLAVRIGGALVGLVDGTFRLGFGDGVSTNINPEELIRRPGLRCYTRSIKFCWVLDRTHYEPWALEWLIALTLIKGHKWVYDFVRRRNSMSKKQQRLCREIIQNCAEPLELLRPILVPKWICANEFDYKFKQAVDVAVRGGWQARKTWLKAFNNLACVYRWEEVLPPQTS